LVALERDVRVQRDSSSEVSFTIPSLSAVIAGLCGGGRKATDADNERRDHGAGDITGAAVLRGSVSATDGRIIPSATVEVQWTAYTRDAASFKLEERVMRATTVTDSSGKFLFCGLPPDRSFRVYAARSAGRRLLPVADRVNLPANSVTIRDITLRIELP
jgi:protocatechuate 3,4-dioxygenase beta subunit